MTRPAALLERDALTDAIDALLPQTQCRRCGYADCHAYAQALATGDADIDRCPPGGAEGVRRLARLTGRPPRPIDPDCGAEGPLRLAVIDEPRCIGCTLCIQACPVDCIVGASKLMHTVIDADCTGCELCVPACPVDCIDMVVVDGERSGWAAWSPDQADRARRAYGARGLRQQRDQREHEARMDTGRRAIAMRHAPEADGGAAAHPLVAAAMRRAQARRGGA